jgi:hypothetical protein
MECETLRQRVMFMYDIAGWRWSEANLLHHHIVSIRKGNTNHHNTTPKPVFKIDPFAVACHTSRVRNEL